MQTAQIIEAPPFSELEFYGWLEEQGDRVVGCACTACGCPLAKYVVERQGGGFAEVSLDRITWWRSEYAFEKRRRPDLIAVTAPWMKDFMRDVDLEGGGQLRPIRAAQALAILEGIGVHA